MKRDMDLIREILVRVEADADRFNPVYAHDIVEPPHLAKRWSVDQASEHMRLLGEAGFIVVEDNQTIDGEVDDAWATRITWAGHEFIANIQNDKVWAKVKSSLVKLGAGASADLVRALAAKAAADVLGL